jgi:hypothetical protein
MTPPDTVTLLPRDTGLRGTRALVFEMAAGIWCVDTIGTRTNPAVTVALGTRFVAAVPQAQPGFVRRHSYQCVAAPAAAYARIAPLRRDPAWRRAVLLPLADPATGMLTYTFIAATDATVDLVEQLIAATLRGRGQSGGCARCPWLSWAALTRCSLTITSTPRRSSSPFAPPTGPIPRREMPVDSLTTRHCQSSAG